MLELSAPVRFKLKFMNTNEQLIFFNDVGRNFGVGFTTPEDWSAMPSSGNTFSFQEFKNKYEIYIADGRRQFSIEIEKIDVNITNLKLVIKTIYDKLNEE